VSYPISYQADLPAERNRLTVFFRLLVAIPIAIVAALFGIAAFFCVIIAWFAILFTGSYPEGLYRFVRGVVMLTVRSNAYQWLQTDTYPPFDTEDHPDYPVRMYIPEEAGEQNRVSVLLRIFLLIPVLIVEYVMLIGVELVGIVVWLVAVFTAKTPPGLHNAMTFMLGYVARATAYATLLTDKWPPFADEGPPGEVASAPAAGSLSSPPPPPPPPPAPTAGDDLPASAPPPPPPPPPPAPKEDDAPGPFGPTT